LHFTTQTDDSHAVPAKIISFHQIKFIEDNFTYIGKVKRGLSN